jgi:hypothetical protein
MTDSIKLVLPLILSPILGIIAALITTNYKFKREMRHEREKEKEHIRLKILNPLLIASEDLLRRFIDIKKRRKDPAKGPEMIGWFRDIKENPWQDKLSFGYWANDTGYFAMSTLYITALYFYYASRIRSDFPFTELESGGETALLSHISEVRTSAGGKFGVWEAMQDSLGTYLASENGGVKNYRNFCELIIDTPENIWFNRLIDFYGDIHLKLDDQIDNIEHSLKSLIEFLNQNLHIKRTEYQVTEESITNLRKRSVPKDVIDMLGPLINQDYKNETYFIDSLVLCVGLDMADDYKPSILKCAKKRLV